MGLRTLSEQEPDHFCLAELGGPAEWRRTDMLVTRVQIRPVLKEDPRLFEIAGACNASTKRSGFPRAMGIIRAM